MGLTSGGAGARRLTGCVATLADGGGEPAEIVKQASRPAIFKWRQTAPELILCAVRWYLPFSLSFREAAARLREREDMNTNLMHHLEGRRL